VKVLGTIKSVIDKITEIICVIILAVMTCLVTYQVFARYVLNSPSAITEALSQYLFVWMIMFGSAYVFGVREHLTIDLIRDKFPPVVEMVVEILSNICLFGFIALVCVYGGWNYTQGQAVQVDPSLLISKAVLYISQPITGIITLYYCIYNIVLAVAKFKGTVAVNKDDLGNSLV
jgi:TRAP-type C4-dicarboxylate transport system permease small subunit